MAMLGNEDYLQRSRMRLLAWSKYVWEDMNLTTIKVPVRKVFKINKRNNSVTLPAESVKVSSVSVIGKHGELLPVFRSEKVEGSDLVDVGAKYDCGCDKKCGNKLCGIIQNYQAIQSVKHDKNPDGTDVSFNCVDRKFILGDTFYEQIQYPLRVYVSGVWVETILNTEDRELCKVEIDAKGCVIDTDENVERLCNSCGYNYVESGNSEFYGGTASKPPAPNVDTWVYYCNSKMDWFATQCGHYPYVKNDVNNYYTISELGDRLIFPPHFGFDKVVIRYYETPNLKDLQIPTIALDTFILGIKWWDCRFNDRKQNLAEKYKDDYVSSKWGLLLELNKYTIEALRMITTPPVDMPSYLPNRPGSINYYP